MSARRESLLAIDILYLVEQALEYATFIDPDTGELTAEGDELFHQIYTEIAAYAMDIELK